ncbi:ABC transporter substrate-binding protein [Rhodococcus sovatensis]|uniref:ABC transporter substrate-binding protein n=1 Tax=Rhodococcus sovatensis TaxID=1805840 RepID=A0ABZ2PN59_9NOCA
MALLRAAVLATATAAALTAGCSAAEPPADQVPAVSGAFPVAVSGALGDGEVAAKPERIVALTWTDADIVETLGVTPISVQKSTAPSGYQPWYEDAINGDLPPLLQSTDGAVPVEQIAALRPDLIVATKAFNLDRTYDQLSQLAPVVHFADTPSTETWQSATTAVASAMGVPEKGAQVIADTETRIDDAARRHSDLDGKTLTFFVGPSESSVYVVNSSEDAGASFLGQLGMTPTDFAINQPVSTIPGRAEISYELLSETDADVIVATGLPGSIEALAERPAVAELPALRRGAFVSLTPTQAQSMAFPSPLSLDWALTEIVPQLNAAAQK